jgi:hypothetical protein
MATLFFIYLENRPINNLIIGQDIPISVGIEATATYETSLSLLIQRSYSSRGCQFSWSSEY